MQVNGELREQLLEKKLVDEDYHWIGPEDSPLPPLDEAEKARVNRFLDRQIQIENITAFTLRDLIKYLYSNPLYSNGIVLAGGKVPQLLGGSYYRRAMQKFGVELSDHVCHEISSRECNGDLFIRSPSIVFDPVYYDRVEQDIAVFLQTRALPGKKKNVGYWSMKRFKNLHYTMNGFGEVNLLRYNFAPYPSQRHALVLPLDDISTADIVRPVAQNKKSWAAISDRILRVVDSSMFDYPVTLYYIFRMHLFEAAGDYAPHRGIRCSDLMEAGLWSLMRNFIQIKDDHHAFATLFNLSPGFLEFPELVMMWKELERTKSTPLFNLMVQGLSSGLTLVDLFDAVAAAAFLQMSYTPSRASRAYLTGRGGKEAVALKYGESYQLVIPADINHALSTVERLMQGDHRELVTQILDKFSGHPGKAYGETPLSRSGRKPVDSFNSEQLLDPQLSKIAAARLMGCYQSVDLEALVRLLPSILSRGHDAARFAVASVLRQNKKTEELAAAMFKEPLDWNFMIKELLSSGLNDVATIAYECFWKEAKPFEAGCQLLGVFARNYDERFSLLAQESSELRKYAKENFPHEYEAFFPEELSAGPPPEKASKSRKSKKKGKKAASAPATHAFEKLWVEVQALNGYVNIPLLTNALNQAAAPNSPATDENKAFLCNRAVECLSRGEEKTFAHDALGKALLKYLKLLVERSSVEAFYTLAIYGKEVELPLEDAKKLVKAALGHQELHKCYQLLSSSFVANYWKEEAFTSELFRWMETLAPAQALHLLTKIPKKRKSEASVVASVCRLAKAWAQNPEFHQEMIKLLEEAGSSRELLEVRLSILEENQNLSLVNRWGSLLRGEERFQQLIETLDVEPETLYLWHEKQLLTFGSRLVEAIIADTSGRDPRLQALLHHLLIEANAELSIIDRERLWRRLFLFPQKGNVEAILSALIEFFREEKCKAPDLCEKMVALAKRSKSEGSWQSWLKFAGYIREHRGLWDDYFSIAWTSLFNNKDISVTAAVKDLGEVIAGDTAIFREEKNDWELIVTNFENSSDIRKVTNSFEEMFVFGLQKLLIKLFEQQDIVLHREGIYRLMKRLIRSFPRQKKIIHGLMQEHARLGFGIRKKQGYSAWMKDGFKLTDAAIEGKVLPECEKAQKFNEEIALLFELRISYHAAGFYLPFQNEFRGILKSVLQRELENGNVAAASQVLLGMVSPLVEYETTEAILLSFFQQTLEKQRAEDFVAFAVEFERSGLLLNSEDNHRFFLKVIETLLTAFDDEENPTAKAVILKAAVVAVEGIVADKENITHLQEYYQNGLRISERIAQFSRDHERNFKNSLLGSYWITLLSCFNESEIVKNEVKLSQMRELFIQRAQRFLYFCKKAWAKPLLNSLNEKVEPPGTRGVVFVESKEQLTSAEHLHIKNKMRSCKKMVEN